MTTASLLSIVIVPVATDLLGRYFGRPFAMPPPAVAGMAVQAVVLPMVAGMAVKRIFPDEAGRIALWRLIGGGTLAMMVTFVAIGLATGHLIAGPGIERQGVLALTTASRHPGIALAWPAQTIPTSALVGLVFCIWS